MLDCAVLGSGDEGRAKVPTGPTLSPEVQALFEGAWLSMGSG